MKIKDIQIRQGNVELVGKIKEKGDAREFEKFGKSGKVCNAVLADDSGEVKLTLWNEQADQVNVGDTVKISNGWVGEYQGEKQLSTGKFGKLEVVDGGSDEESASEPTAASAEPKQPAEEKPEVDEEMIE